MKASDDRLRHIVSLNLIIFFIGFVWRILIESFDIFSSPSRELIFLRVGGVSIFIGLLLAIPLIRLDMKGANINIKTYFWNLFLINNFFWFGAIVWILHFTK
jgi:hypothetical protein